MLFTSLESSLNAVIDLLKRTPFQRFLKKRAASTNLVNQKYAWNLINFFYLITFQASIINLFNLISAALWKWIRKKFALILSCTGSTQKLCMTGKNKNFIRLISQNKDDGLVNLGYFFSWQLIKELSQLKMSLLFYIQFPRLKVAQFSNE